MSINQQLSINLKLLVVLKLMSLYYDSLIFDNKITFKLFSFSTVSSGKSKEK